MAGGKALTRLITRFLRDDSAATAIEYALLGTLIAVALAATFAAAGDMIIAMFGFGTGGPTDIIIERGSGL